MTLVICAPGYPGSTEQAHEIMEDLAHGIAEGAGWSREALRAEYYEKLEQGLERIGQDDVGIAIVGLPFYLAYREQLGLEALLQVEPEEAPTEQWTLVAKDGVVTGPDTLDGWQVSGLAGYAPGFVRHVALGEWGTLPDSVDIRFSKRAVGELRKAARGEPVAVLLDRAQSDALDSLPFADDLQVVARSKPMVSSLVCRVGDRMNGMSSEAVTSALLKLSKTKSGSALLESIRVQRFRPLDDEGLARVSEAYEHP